jgi:hypothetical protein
MRWKVAHGIDYDSQYAIVENAVLHTFRIAMYVPDANITDFGKLVQLLHAAEGERLEGFFIT